VSDASETQQAPEEQQPVSPFEEPTVDLVEEAGNAAAKTPPPKEQKIRSLDDLDLDGGIRSQIESYVSKAINEAVSKHDERQQKKLTDDGYMNRSQIEQLLADKEKAYRTREEAKERFLTILGSEGLHPGSEGYAKVQKTYQEAVSAGRLTPEILLTEAGIRTLVALSGASTITSAAPQSGLTRSAPAPDGSVAYGDGTIQLNVGASRSAFADNLRKSVEASIRNQQTS
jgi:hypothetical protein